MSHNSRTLVALLFIVWLALPAFSQDVESIMEKTSKTEGLKKISSSSRNWDFDIRIDHKALEANIESAIEEAMRSIEVSLEKLAIHVEPVEINLTNLNTNIDPIIVDIPHLNINIEPITIDLERLEALDDMEFDMDEWDHEWDSDAEDMDEVAILQQKDHDKEKHKEKHNKSKDKHKSTKEKDKPKDDKAKGLKKIN